MDVRARRAPVLASLLVACAAILSGCGGTKEQTASGGSSAACLSDVSRVLLPRGFPSAFPFPPTTVVHAVRPLPGGYKVLHSRLHGEIESARDYVMRELPRAGFNLGQGDAEEQEAETDFSGHGISGRLKLHTLLGCPGALTLDVAYRAKD